MKLSLQRNSPKGSDFEDFLRGEGRLEDSTALAIKRLLAWEFSKAIRTTGMSQAEVAYRMWVLAVPPFATCLTLPPSVTLAMVSRAAKAL